MVDFAQREYAETLVRKALCSCFLAVDGTITLRREKVRDAAQVVTSCLASHGLLECGMDVFSVEKVIHAFVQPNGESAAPVSVKASVVAGRICGSKHGFALAA